MTTFNKTLAKPTNNYFDLLYYADDCKSAVIAAEIASSTAWRIDNMIVQHSRGLLRYIKTELFNTGGYDSLAEVQMAFADAAFAELNFHEIGKSETGLLEMLRALNAQRDQWHDLAAKLVPMVSDYSGMPRTYEIEDISKAFYKEPNLRVNEMTSRRLKIRAERMAAALEAPELAEEQYKRSLQRKEDDNKRIASVLVDQAPIAELMFKLTLRSDDDSAALRSKDFWDLPIEAQRILLDNAIGAASRADERAASDRSMSEMEYDLTSMTALKVMTDLRQVMAGERFKVATREATQV